MRVICIASQKGGTGKTTTAAAIGQAAARQGQHVLVIDLDAQGSLTVITGARGAAPGSYDLMKGRDPADLIQHIPGQPDIIPGSLKLAGADAELAARPGRDFLLQRSLQPLKGYDLVLIDCPPTLGTLLVNGLTAATDVIIPLQADTFAVQNLFQIRDTITQVQQYCNPDLRITGALLTRYSPRTVLARDLRDAIAAQCTALDIPLLKTYIRDGVALKEAQTLKQNLFDYAPRSNPAKDYMQLYKEIIK